MIHVSKIVKSYFNRYILAPYQKRFVIPPYEEKRSILKQYASQYHLSTFIETGTLFGETIEAMVNDFKKLYSIELSQELFKKAQAKFLNQEKVTILQGDSGKVLKEILQQVNAPCLFWLDGHYSSKFMHEGELIVTAKTDTNTPILQELKCIMEHPIKNHVILIDDARCFGVVPDYPKISELKNFLFKHNPALKVSVKRDIIRIEPALSKV